MNQSKLHHTVVAVSILLSMLACVAPAQTIPPTVALDPNAIETSIVGTLEAAARQTEQAGASFPTGTLIITETLTPTPKVSSSGTALVDLADGSTQFLDYVAGMQMVFPPGWLAVRLGEEEYYAAWGRPEAANPHFQAIYTSIQDLDPKEFRVHALDLQPQRMINNRFSHVEVLFVEGNTWTLDEIKKNETENHPPLANYKLLSSDIFEMPQGIQALNLEMQWTSSETETGYRKRVYFKVPGGTMLIGLVISSDLKEIALPQLDQMIKSVSLFTP